MNRAVSDMLGLNDLWEDLDVTSDLFKAKNGKLPRYGGGLTPLIPMPMTSNVADNNKTAHDILSYVPFVRTAIDGKELLKGDIDAATPFLIGAVSDTFGGRSIMKAWQARRLFQDALKQRLPIH